MGVARRRHFAHVAPLRAVLVGFGVLAGALLLIGVWFVRAPLPKISGTTAVRGISAEVTIRRDQRGIPHILAASATDAFFGQGYACAQDRLWQMDILRREAEGRLSEILGPSTIGVDTYFRTIGFAEVAKASVARATHAKAELDAFAAGVNAAAADRPLPLEFRVLGYSPEPWTAADSVAVGLLVTRSQDDNWKELLLRADLAKKIGEAAAYSLVDEQVPQLEEFLPGYASSNARARASERMPAPGRNATRVAWTSAATRGVVPPPLAGHQGSNNWAVAPSRTVSGKPVLSNDTHLDHTLPSTWWLSQVEGGDLDVEGFTLPGLPGVVIGHNRRVAWGVTSAAEDVEDLYVERFASPASDRYLADGRWVRAVHRHERVLVKGRSPLDLDVLVTRHGPVVRRNGSEGLALQWTILRDGIGVVVGDVDRAHDWASFREALSGWTGPTLNFVYADVDGHIGYQDAGRVPLRAAGDGSIPVEGQDDRFAWRGDVPFGSLPHALDPARGFLASANNALVPPGFTPSLSRDYLSPYRIHEIVRRLSAPGKRTPEQLGAIQGDVFEYPRSRLAAVAIPILAASSTQEDRDASAMLSRWTGQASLDEGAPTFLAALDEALQDRLLRPRVGADLTARYVKDGDHHLITPLVRVLDGDTSLSAMGITRASVLAAIIPAAHDAESRLGYPTHPLSPWGDTNAAVYAHPLSSAGWPLTVLSAPTIPQPGDPFTVFQSKPGFGPSMRFVADLGDWDHSSMLLTLGESGIWTDPHYVDMERDWAAVTYAPTPFTDRAVDKATWELLRLEPRE